MSTDRAASGSSAPKEEKADDAELENLKEPAETSLSIKSGSIQRLSVNVGKKWKPHGRGSTSVTGSHHSTNLIPVLEDENDEDYDFAVQYLQRRKTMNVLKYEDPEEELQSAMQKRKGHTKRWINTWVWMIRIGPLVAALALIGYFFMLVANPDNWESGVVEQDGDNEEDGDAVLKRTVNRGMVMSIIVSFVITFMGGYMFHVGVPEGMVITNFGFVLAPVIGYMFDVGIATDEGWRLFMTWDGITFAFASLISGNFVRYVVTFFLDLFISNPLQDILKRQARAGGIMESLKENDATNKWIRAWDHKLVENFPAILQAIVGFITFNAYTNQTRFAWAYPKPSVPREKRITPGAIMLSTAIAGILYLNFYCLMDIMSERAYYDVNVKLGYVMAIFLILYMLNWQDTIEAPVAGEEDNNLTEWMGALQPILGFLVFVGFVLYGAVWPLYTKIGCCGRWKPDPPPRVTVTVNVDDFKAALADESDDDLAKGLDFSEEESDDDLSDSMKRKSTIHGRMVHFSRQSI